MPFHIRHLLVYLCAALLAVAPGLAWGGSGDKCVRLVKDEDFKAAYRECKSVAERGNADAQFELGMMYYKGKGVIEDPQEAYVWFLLAAQSGKETPKSAKENLKKTLGPDQISAATDKAKLKQFFWSLPLLDKIIDLAVWLVVLLGLFAAFFGLLLLGVLIAGQIWRKNKHLLDIRRFCFGSLILQAISILVISIPISGLIGLVLSRFMGLTQVFTLIGAFLGPFLALLFSIGTYEKQQKTQRRIRLFNTLVALKKYDFSLERAQALNEVKLEFNEPDVKKAWVTYVDYMDQPEQARDEARREELYKKLLESMAEALGQDTEDIDHSFAPQAHRNLEKLDVNWKTSLLKVLVGEEPIATRDSERGVAEALYLQGVRFRDGDGVPPNPEKAARLFREAFEHSYKK